MKKNNDEEENVWDWDEKEAQSNREKESQRINTRQPLELIKRSNIKSCIEAIEKKEEFKNQEGWVEGKEESRVNWAVRIKTWSGAKKLKIRWQVKIKTPYDEGWVEWCRSQRGSFDRESLSWIVDLPQEEESLEKWQKSWDEQWSLWTEKEELRKKVEKDKNQEWEPAWIAWCNRLKDEKEVEVLGFKVKRIESQNTESKVQEWQWAVEFAYDVTRLEILKSFRKFRWNVEEKYWVAKESDLKEFAAWLEALKKTKEEWSCNQQKAIKTMNQKETIRQLKERMDKILGSCPDSIKWESFKSMGKYEVEGEKSKKYTMTIEPGTYNEWNFDETRGSWTWKVPRWYLRLNHEEANYGVFWKQSKLDQEGMIRPLSAKDWIEFQEKKAGKSKEEQDKIRREMEQKIKHSMNMLIDLQANKIEDGKIKAWNESIWKKWLEPKEKLTRGSVEINGMEIESWMEGWLEDWEGIFEGRPWVIEGWVKDSWIERDGLVWWEPDRIGKTQEEQDEICKRIGSENWNKEGRLIWIDAIKQGNKMCETSEGKWKWMRLEIWPCNVECLKFLMKYHGDWWRRSETLQAIIRESEELKDQFKKVGWEKMKDMLESWIDKQVLKKDLGIKRKEIFENELQDTGRSGRRRL